MASLLNVSYSAAVNICNRSSHGDTDEEIIGTKKRPKFKSNSDIKAQLFNIVMQDNSLTQKGFADALLECGISRSQAFI